MCGIIGYASMDKQYDATWIKNGMAKMSHRGPDGNGIFISSNKQVIFGHQRLSIFDLTENAKQPMTLNDHGISITYNGEIYNFKKLKDELLKDGIAFKSRSDTEVLLYAYLKWDIDFLDKLKGQFAFVIYDKRKNILLMARDISGEKPLFYHIENNNISFSSEMKGLFENKKIDRKIDRASFHYYLQNGYVPSPSSIIKGVYKLSPGSAMTIDLNNFNKNEWKFWDLPDFEESDINEFEAVDQLHTLLKDSVDLQLEADVPVGILLSGGVDSSLITALSAEIRNSINTYTVIFPNDPDFNEQQFSRNISEYFSTCHTELEVDVSSVDILEKLAYQYDEPMIDSSMIPTYYLSKEIKKYCTVALGGDGGDELFGGYHHHARFVYLEKKLNKYPQIFRNLISASSNKMLPIGFKGRNWAAAIETNFKHSLPHNSIFFDDKDISALIPNHYFMESSSKDLRNKLISKINLSFPDIVQRSTRFDFKNYLCEDILVKVDRASMLNSLEMRAPFLDKDVINFAYKYIPSSLKANSNFRKIILQKLARKILPPNYDSSRKQGFSIPLKSWLRTPEWKELINTYLLASDCIFCTNQIKKILRYQEIGFSNSERIFGLLMFEIWRKNYDVKL